MLKLCREYFDDEAKDEGGILDFEEQEFDGAISFDGEDLEMDEEEWLDVWNEQELPEHEDKRTEIENKSSKNDY